VPLGAVALVGLIYMIYSSYRNPVRKFLEVVWRRLFYF